jgi:hypothetical protein
MSKSMKAFVLAGILSIAAASAAQAGGKVVGSDFRGHANVAPAGGTARSGQIPPLWRPVLAGGGKVGSDFHASAARACDTDRCPVLAGDGGPVGAGDNNGRSMASATARSGQIPALWRPVLAGDGGPGSPTDGTSRSGARMADDGPVGAGDHNGRSSAALSKGGAEFLVASIRAGQGDF